MKIDIHCHVAGNGVDINNADNDVYCYAEDNQHWFTRILYNMLEDDLVRMEADLNRDGIISTSALSLSTRLPYIQEIVETFPSEWLVHGSDFPIPIDSWPHLPLVTHDITPEEYIKICKTKNPFDRDVRIKRAHGFSGSILENAEEVLRLPE